MVRWIDHEVPFHRSANVDVVVRMSLVTAEDPKAAHAVVETHETAESSLGSAPGGFGVDRIFHVLPFQDATWVTWDPALTSVPTAMQTAFTHATPASELLVTLGSEGTAWMAHALPFHRSTRLLWTKLVPSVLLPTEVQAPGDVQETETSEA